MKIGLFLAVLVLLAAAHVHGQDKDRSGRRKSRTSTTTVATTLVDDSTKSGTDATDEHDLKDGEIRTHKKIVTTKEEETITKSKGSKGKDDGKDRQDKVAEKDRKEEDRQDKVVGTDLTEKVDRPNKIVGIDLTGKGDRQDKLSGKDRDEEDRRNKLGDKDRKDRLEGEDHQDPNRIENGDDEHRDSGEKKDTGKGRVELVDRPRTPAKSVHIHGSITLVKYRPSVVETVQYDLDGSLANTDNQRSTRPFLPFARDFLARGSHVTLYVSTSKTNDPKLAFAKFPVLYKQHNFPLTFELDIDLPDKQRGLLERADITLYFFAYITDSGRVIDTFLPAGISQILLKGTDRNVQPLEVFVRANGLEVNGLFRSRYGQRFIEPGTVFQVIVVDQATLIQKKISTTNAVAQLTISNVPSMFPVPFSLLVHYQMLKPNTKYYALAYVIVKGVRRLVNREPVWLISEQRLLITPQLVFNVVPAPLILKGLVTRSMPGSFVVQPGSSLGINLRVIGSREPDIVYRIPEVTILPQYFQINISESTRFDPTQNYEITAQLTDKNNDIYMISSQAIPILDDMGKITIPVDDYLYYVQARMQSSTGEELNYIPGSTCRIFVTETPETPTKPVVSMTIKDIPTNFRDVTLKIPTTGIQANRNYYLVMMIEIKGIITHVSKTLLISNSQRPPLLIQLPVLSLNLIRGVISDIDQRPAQWSSSAYAKLYLLDDTIADPEKAIVQSWKIHLENDFPIRFEVQIDFNRLNLAHVYRLQAVIENGRNLFEYKPATSAIAVDPRSGLLGDVRIFVRNIKTSQRVRGLIQINGVKGPLPERSELILQISTTPSLDNSRIVDEFRIKVDNRTLPVDFDIELPLNKFDLNAVYYFIVKYTVRNSVVIPATQVFAFSPRNQATVVITLSRTPQIVVKGQVTSTGSSLDLPPGTTLHLYITDDLTPEKPFIYSEVYLQSTPNSLYEFTMLVDSIILEKKIPLYLHADIIYEDAVILRMPRPALLQLALESTWNINLIIDLPTLVIGEIVSITNEIKVNGEFDAYIQIIRTSTKEIVHTVRLRVGARLPQRFRIELDNDLFIRYPDLRVRALIKNCKEETLYESGGDIDVHIGLNLNTRLSVLVKDSKKLTELRTNIDESASLYAGRWRLAVNGVTSRIRYGELVTNLEQK